MLCYESYDFLMMPSIDINSYSIHRTHERKKDKSKMLKIKFNKKNNYILTEDLCFIITNL